MRTRRKLVIVAIQLLVAGLHFAQGPGGLGGPFGGFVNAWGFDIAVPFGFYFLLCLLDDDLARWLPGPTTLWLLKATVVFLAASAVEVAQAKGLHVLGETFDPLDFAMYGAGVLLAAFLDVVVFPRVFGFWRPSAAASR